MLGVARADSATLKIGYIACMSGPRTDFGAAGRGRSIASRHR